MMECLLQSTKDSHFVADEQGAHGIRLHFQRTLPQDLSSLANRRRQRSISLDLTTFILPERTTVVIGRLIDLSLDKTRPPQGGLAPHLLTGTTAGVVGRMMIENKKSCCRVLHSVRDSRHGSRRSSHIEREYRYNVRSVLPG